MGVAVKQSAGCWCRVNRATHGGVTRHVVWAHTLVLWGYPNITEELFDGISVSRVLFTPGSNCFHVL